MDAPCKIQGSIHVFRLVNNMCPGKWVHITHGDAIYSISIKGKALPFWIYGRDVTFIGKSMVMVESVRCKTWDPIETIIIDLENEVYAGLKNWYTDISFIHGRIEFTNQVVKMDKRILNNFENLEWISF